MYAGNQDAAINKSGPREAAVPVVWETVSKEKESGNAGHSARKDAEARGAGTGQRPQAGCVRCGLGAACAAHSSLQRPPAGVWVRRMQPASPRGGGGLAQLHRQALAPGTEKVLTALFISIPSLACTDFSEFWVSVHGTRLSLHVWLSSLKMLTSGSILPEDGAQHSLVVPAL